jgi:hypothetical protein
MTNDEGMIEYRIRSNIFVLALVLVLGQKEEFTEGNEGNEGFGKFVSVFVVFVVFCKKFLNRRKR